MINLFSIIALGFFLGMRHATDPDHVIAVSTIVTRQRDLARSALIGAFWGLGHTLTILTVGTAIIFFGVVVPPRIGLSMEFSVALMLIILGMMNISSFFRSMPEKLAHAGEQPQFIHSHAHAHGEYVHSHPHGHSPDIHSHSPQQTPLARLDRRLDGLNFYRQVRPLVVGIVHGLAGSAAVALLVLTTIRDSRWALAYLLVFGVGTIAGMMLITMSMACAFRFVGGGNARFSQRLSIASGIVSLSFGVLVAYQILFVNGLATLHPHWMPR
jgi:ABC-type nickel/cobalt efflux system permease component RcnA